MKEKFAQALGPFLLLVMVYLWYKSLYILPADMHQGDVYRIIYLHVPAAFASFLLGFVLLGVSVYGLITKKAVAEFSGRAASEIGFIFTLLTLATGSIWGKPTWGTWWTWDARLTTTFILAVLYAGYLLLWSSLPQGLSRTKATGILGVLIAVDIPIIYKSVTWWRTLHQPPSMMREGGSTMAPEILNHLLLSILVLSLVSVYFWWKRSKILHEEWQIEQKSLSVLGG